MSKTMFLHLADYCLKKREIEVLMYRITRADYLRPNYIIQHLD